MRIQPKGLFMSTNEQVSELVRLIFSEYKTALLNEFEASQVSNRSVASLRKDRAQASGIPTTLIPSTAGKRPNIKYNIQDIANFIVSCKAKVA